MKIDQVIAKILDSYKDESVVLNTAETEYRKRIEFIMEEKLKNIALSDFDLYKRLKKNGFRGGFPEAVRYISVAERIIAFEKDPNGDPHKTWDRYFISEVTKMAIAKAIVNGNEYNMAYAVNIYGKHKLTDKEDTVRLPYDQIIPFLPEITSDVSVLGIEPIKNLEARKAELMKKYGIIQDAEILKHGRTEE